MVHNPVATIPVPCSLLGQYVRVEVPVSWIKFSGAGNRLVGSQG